MRVKCNKCKTTYVSDKHLKNGVCRICISDEEDNKALRKFRKKRKSSSWLKKQM